MDADPATKKWLKLGSDLLGGEEQRKQAVNGLVEELGTELGIPESDRARLKMLSEALLKALRDDGNTLPPPGAPDDPAEPPTGSPKP